MTLEEALEHAAMGEAILFLGAGFSLGATNVKGQPFRAGGSLANFLSLRVGIPEESPLEDAGQMFAERFGVDELIKELRREYSVGTITSAQKTIATLPWKRAYTTNYDNVFEQAAAQVGKVVVPVPPDSKIQLTAKQDPLCIHLNGYIDHLNRDTIWTSFKLRACLKKAFPPFSGGSAICTAGNIVSNLTNNIALLGCLFFRISRRSRRWGGEKCYLRFRRDRRSMGVPPPHAR